MYGVPIIIIEVGVAKTWFALGLSNECFEGHCIFICPLMTCKWQAVTVSPMHYGVLFLAAHYSRII